MGRQMGQTFVVENKPGSGTLVGTDFVAKAAPDGYTLLVGSVSNLALNPGPVPQPAVRTACETSSRWAWRWPTATH